MKRIKNLDKVRKLLDEYGVESAIGYETLARILSKQLKRRIRSSRVPVSMQIGELAIVVQYRGPSLEEGVEDLPRNAELNFFGVKVLPSRVKPEEEEETPEEEEREEAQEQDSEDENSSECTLALSGYQNSSPRHFNPDDDEVDEDDAKWNR